MAIDVGLHSGRKLLEYGDIYYVPLGGRICALGGFSPDVAPSATFYLFFFWYLLWCFLGTVKVQFAATDQLSTINLLYQVCIDIDVTTIMSDMPDDAV